MTALRQQAYDLLDSMPEGKLCLIIDILQAFKRNDIMPDNNATNVNPIDFSKYMGRGKKIFASTEEIDDYLRASRDERI